MQIFYLQLTRIKKENSIFQYELLLPMVPLQFLSLPHVDMKCEFGFGKVFALAVGAVCASVRSTLRMRIPKRLEEIHTNEKIVEQVSEREREKLSDSLLSLHAANADDTDNKMARKMAIAEKIRIGFGVEVRCHSLKCAHRPANQFI